MTTILDAIHADAEAIERALVAGLLDVRTELPDSDVVAAIAAVAREADLAPGGLAALFADDYWHDPQAWSRRMHTALELAAHLNHAQGQLPALPGMAEDETNGGHEHV